MEDLCHFHINSFDSSFKTFSIQSGVFPMLKNGFNGEFSINEIK